MKKILLIMVGLLLIMTSCKVHDKNSNLEFYLTEEVTDYDFSNHIPKYGMFGGYQYYGLGYEPKRVEDGGLQIDPDECVIYTLTAYPDYSSKGLFVTSIEITDPDISYFGLNINSTYEEIEKVMKDLGFKKDKENGNIFKKGKYIYSFYDNVIYLRVEVTNIFGIVF